MDTEKYLFAVKRLNVDTNCMKSYDPEDILLVANPIYSTDESGTILKGENKLHQRAI